MRIFRFSAVFYLISIIGLFLYSFTQVDLSLTLSSWSIWQVVQKFFQHIGYFQRPLSTLLFVIIVFSLFAFYLLILHSIRHKAISKKTIWILIILSAVILNFSYNAFSYDLFNYIFDAKIITYYGQNPYTHKALDYASDPMLSFMHWTHRVYPYGPIWLFLTVPLSFIGVNFFLPTFFLFKALASISFLGTSFFIAKILRRISPQNEAFGLVFFAFNPLVIIESLVSAHNDIVMMFLTMSALYLLINTKYIRSLIFLILSIGIKFATVFLAPIFLIIYFLKKSINWQIMFFLLLSLMTIAVVGVSIRTNFQPWYLLYVLPFSALLSKKYFVFIPAVTISFFALLEYIPFLYLGHWNNPVPSILFWLTATSIILSFLLVLLRFLKMLK